MNYIVESYENYKNYEEHKYTTSHKTKTLIAKTPQ